MVDDGLYSAINYVCLLLSSSCNRKSIVWLNVHEGEWTFILGKVNGLEEVRQKFEDLEVGGMDWGKLLSEVGQMDVIYLLSVSSFASNVLNIDTTF